MTRLTHLSASTARITSVQPDKRQRQHHRIFMQDIHCLVGGCCKETRWFLTTTTLIGASPNGLLHMALSFPLHQQATMNHYRRYPRLYTLVTLTYRQRVPQSPGPSQKVGQRIKDQPPRLYPVIERIILLHRQTLPVRSDRRGPHGHWLLPPKSAPKTTFPKASSVTSRGLSTSQLIISASRRSRIIRPLCCSTRSPAATDGV